MTTLVERMIGSARLDAEVFEEVEHDTQATTQALLVVVLSSVAAGIGMRAGLAGVLAGALASIAGWYVWTFLTYWIGTRLLPEPQTQADHGELLRTIGFATSPGLLRVVGVIPPLRGFVFLAASIWMLVAAVVAIRQALDYRSTWRAVAVCAIGWVVQAILFAVVLSLLGHAAG